VASKKKQIKTYINPENLDLQEDYYESNSEEDFIDKMDISNGLVWAALHFRKQHIVIVAKIIYVSEINREVKLLNPIDYYYNLFKVEYKTNNSNFNVPNIEARIRTLLVEYFIKNLEKMKLLGSNEQELFEMYPEENQKFFECVFSASGNDFLESPAGNQLLFENYSEKNQKCFGCGFRASGNIFLESSAGDQFLKCPKCNIHFQRTD
jgi:hypothetical protein